MNQRGASFAYMNGYNVIFTKGGVEANAKGLYIDDIIMCIRLTISMCVLFAVF